MHHIHITSTLNYTFTGNLDGTDFIIITRNYMYKTITKLSLLLGKNHYSLTYNHKLRMKYPKSYSQVQTQIFKNYNLFTVNLENARLKFYKIK